MNEIETISKTVKNGILTTEKFSDNKNINEKLLKALESNNYIYMTHIQSIVIPKLMNGEDVLGSAKTGSGKTIAFVVPALDLLYQLKAKHSSGTIVLILTPTRELALQIFDVIQLIGQNMTQTKGCVIGGSNRKEEAKKLVKGVNILVATPGRILDHLENCKQFKYSNLSMLIIDEADQMLNIGFERELTKILEILPKERQTALFSATQTNKVSDIVRISMKKPVFIEAKDETKTVAGLSQYYIVCDNDIRLAILYKLLKEKSKIVLGKDNSENAQMKIMVFFSTCQSTQFHEELFSLFNKFLPIYSLHGKLKQNKRVEIYNKFCKQNQAILFCTNVAARGLDFPAVNFIIQYDPPDEIKEYIHRVGRTARGQEATGMSLLFLSPSETKFCDELVSNNIVVKRVQASYLTIDKIQAQLELLVSSTPELKAQAILSFKKYLLAYNSLSAKNIYIFENLDLNKVAKSFALSATPRVDLPGVNGLKRRKKFPKHNTAK